MQHDLNFKPLKPLEDHVLLIEHPIEVEKEKTVDKEDTEPEFYELKENDEEVLKIQEALANDITNVQNAKRKLAKDLNEMEEIDKEEAALKLTVLSQPNLFASSFKAGCLLVNPVEIELNDKAERKPYVSKVRPLVHEEPKIVLRKWINSA